MLLQVTEFLKAIGLPGAALPPDSRRRMFDRAARICDAKGNPKETYGRAALRTTTIQAMLPDARGADPVERTPAAAERVPKMATRS
jgi:hypothetical protein